MYLCGAEPAAAPAPPPPAGAVPVPATTTSLAVAASLVVPTLVLAAGLLLIGLFNAWIVQVFIEPMLPPGL
jgi:hypothetical protein